MNSNTNSFYLRSIVHRTFCKDNLKFNTFPVKIIYIKFTCPVYFFTEIIFNLYSDIN